MSTRQQINGENEENEAELVSEFPPPPFYYKYPSLSLTPPQIPKEEIERSTKESIRKKAALEAEERNRLGGDMNANGERGLCGPVPDFGGTLDGPTISIFGQENYLEDPDLIPISDDFSDPQDVKAEVGRLNKEILQGFMKLVGVLVNSPMEQGPCREELMKNIEQLLKECNKFREHQARELMIETLEKQLLDRKHAVEELGHQISKASKFLSELSLSEEKQIQ